MNLDWDYANPFVQSISPQPGHIDELDHVNNAVYVQWMEDCAWRHSARLGLGLAGFTRLDRSMAVLRHEIDYLASARLNDLLLLATWLIKPSRRLKLERRFQLLRQNDGKCLLRARTTYVCGQLSSGQPKRMPAEFIAAYSKDWLVLEQQA